MTAYSKAPESVIHIANELIEKYHTHLLATNIGFIFRTKATTSGGKTVFAKARKPPAWLEVYKNLDFIIEIAGDEWNNLTSDQRQALIDHELCHCGYDEEDERAYIITHDIEEFRAVIDRHGFWNADLLKATHTFQEAIQTEFKGFRKAKIDGKVIAVDPDEFNQAQEESVPA